MNRTQRAIEYCIDRKLFGSATAGHLVVSGGVANNDYIFNDLSYLTKQYNWQIYRPSKKYCSDNGVMIAWNGVEQYKALGAECFRWNYDSIEVMGKVQLGELLLQEIGDAQIKCKWIHAAN